MIKRNSYEVLPTADDGYLVSNGNGAIRFDFNKEYVGIVTQTEFNEIKQKLGYFEEISAKSVQEALNNFLKLS